MNGMISIAYLRRSISGGHATDEQEAQLAIVTALAERDGRTIDRVYAADWGVSGGRKSIGKRFDYARMIQDVRSGQVAAIYAYDADRLARSTKDGMDLWNACEDDGQPIIVTDRRVYRTDDPSDRGRFVQDVENAAYELDRTTKRSRNTKSFLRDHALSCTKPPRPHRAKCSTIGCHDTTHCTYAHVLGGREFYGDRPGEDIGAVVAAYRSEGSFRAAATKLTAEGVPTRLGRPWFHTAVADIVRRSAPEEAPEIVPGGRASPKRALTFSGLLRCHCGAVMQGMNRSARRMKLDGTPGAASVSYLCDVAARDPNHPRPYMIAERRVLAFARAEAKKRWSVKLEPVWNAKWVEKTTGEMNTKRRLWAQQQEDGILTREEVLAKLAALRTTERKVAAVRRVEAIVGSVVDWTDSPAEINRTLRAAWWSIEVELRDGRLEPVHVSWVVDPEEIDEVG